MLGFHAFPHFTFISKNIIVYFFCFVFFCFQDTPKETVDKSERVEKLHSQTPSKESQRTGQLTANTPWTFRPRPSDRLQIRLERTALSVNRDVLLGNYYGSSYFFAGDHSESFHAIKSWRLHVF